MRVSLGWLREMIDLPEPAADVAERLTLSGFEVEAIERPAGHLQGVVAGEVLAVRPHPSRDDLRVVAVGDASGSHDVVCGAPNVPAPGGRAAYAPVGAKVGDVAVDRRKLGGVPSEGVLCSEEDLGIGVDAAGLLLLPDDAPRGADLHEVLGLDDDVFDVGVTPNRPDGLGHLGIARELGALYRRPVRLPRPPDFARAPESAAVTVTLEDPAGCPRYGAQLVRGLTIRPSPWRLRWRLHCLGVRAVSNVVDVTNLVLLLYSQPLHAFDLERLRGGRIVVRRARPGERMATLDEVERTFAAEDLLICDGEGPVAVAGVMGGLDSEIRGTTTDVLIECAHFDPRSIRRTSRRLGLASESSYRFERGTDRGGIPDALAWAAGTMVALGGGRVCGEMIDAGGPGPAREPTRLRPARLARIVGRAYADDEIRGTLERLGCAVTAGPGGELAVRPPSWRGDLGREIDLIEEVARVVGYESVPSTPPTIVAGPREPGSWERLGALRELLAARGLSEAVNHVFGDAATLTAFGADEAACVRLANPLDAERSLLRTTLLPGLLGNVRTAAARREPSAALFEIGRTFHRKAGGGEKARSDARPGGALPVDEVHRLGIVLFGRRPEWLAGSATSWDLYDAAAVIAAAAEGVLRRPWELRSASEALPWCHPRTACVVGIGGEAAGFVGELHPRLADRLDVPRGVLVAEVELGAERFASEPAQARELPRFPAVRRDVAAVFDEEVTAGAVTAAARGLGPEFLESVTVFDVYRGEPVPAGRKSMAFALLYRHPERTLTDEEVEAAHGRIVDGLVAQFGVTIRR